MFTDYSDAEAREIADVIRRPKVGIGERKKATNAQQQSVDVSKLDIKTLAKAGSVKRFDAGTVLFREGDEGDEMYFILSGSVEVLDGNEQALATIGAGEMFGEMSLVERMPRSATVRVLDTLTALIINSQNFEKVIAWEPAVAFRIMQALSKRVRQLNQSIFLLKSKEFLASKDDDW
jgi:CRP-like cAMP-binding protein